MNYHLNTFVCVENTLMFIQLMNNFLTMVNGARTWLCKSESCSMSLIHALLLLPRHGEPIAVGRQVAMELRVASPRFVRRRDALWSLTRDGQRFLVQFRSERSDTITQTLRVRFE